MRDKIIHLMKSEGLTTTRLAEILQIQPSAVSHLVSGRNKPGYDLLQKILRRFSRINPDWLLLDSDEMYRSDTTSDSSDSPLADEPVFDFLSDNDELKPLDAVDLSEVDVKEEASSPLVSAFKQSKRGDKSPIFVVLFYDDGSCESFSMRR